MIATPFSSRASDDVNDPELPTLGIALNPVAAGAALAEPLRRAFGGDCRVTSLRTLAYKPGRRCLIEYGVTVRHADDSEEQHTVLGKIRARRFGKSGYRQLSALWNAGFSEDAPDGIWVPRPVGVAPRLRMWLQHKVDGAVASQFIAGDDGVQLALRIAAAAQKLHAAGVPADRRHTIVDELRILDDCFAAVADRSAGIAVRLAALARMCERAASALPEPCWCGSHRDFYADQVIVAGTRLYLLDFDLYCEADPGLDIGNFLGHITEQALRTCGAADALAHVEHALEEGFVARAGEDVRHAVRTYAALTVARHVYLSTRVAGRQHLTRSLVSLAEDRVQSLLAAGGHA